MIFLNFLAQDLDWFQYHRSEIFNLTCTARKLYNIMNKKIDREIWDYLTEIIKEKKIAILEKSKLFLDTWIVLQK